MTEPLQKEQAAKLPRGFALLREPSLNKGTAFTSAERDAFGLRGLLPPRIFNQSQRVDHVLRYFRRKPNDLERYMYLSGLQDRNERLFYRTLIDHFEEFAPIVYTPTVGLACQEFSHYFRMPRGMYITKYDRGQIKNVLENWHHKDVRAIVVTDGERILGLGDLGVNGMGIPIGKLSLYTACAGIDPESCLPIVIDVGTNNNELLKSRSYIGIQEPRMRGREYDELIDEFMEAASEAFPQTLIQMEDFGNINAFRLLEKYRHQYCMFNDDIQGTAATALSGLYSALRITGGKLTGQKLLFFGAGEAGLGIGNLVVSAMVQEGLSEEDARKNCWFVDSKGLIVASRHDLTEHKLPFAHDFPFQPNLLAAVEALKPTGIIGVSAQQGSFTPDILKAMAGINERPIIFALSNPTSRSECTAEEAYRLTNGRAVFASGSPFAPLVLNGKTFVAGQANNSYIFPGVGLGVVASQAKTVTDEMFSVAARVLSDQVTQDDLDLGRIFPSLSQIREVSLNIAAAVAKIAFDRGLAGIEKPDDTRGFIKSCMYDPTYPEYTR
jgi:malate dehydrogenase (oxaloacetate-decarboxylating)(NADP+)